MNLERVATIAIQALGASKRYVDTVGGLSQFECIRNAAIRDTLDRYFPYDVASFLDSEVNLFQEESARLLLDLADSSLSDGQFDAKLERFSEFVNRAVPSRSRDISRSEFFGLRYGGGVSLCRRLCTCGVLSAAGLNSLRRIDATFLGITVR